MPVGGKQTYRFGSFELDTQCGQLRRDGVGLKLQGQPVQILEVLLETPGELVTREQLRDRLWSSDTFVDFDHSLNTAIKRLRQALGDEADTPRYIETLPRRGYRFIGELCPETIPNVDTEPVKEDIVSKVAATMADAAMDAASNSRRHRRIVWWITATIAVLLLSAAAVYWLTKPMPLPHIVASHALTKTKFRKLWGQNLLLTDGVNLYFQEKELSNVKSVNLAGGETSEVQIPWKQALLRDISSGGSGLLFSVYDANSKDFDAWIQPLPPGSARLIVKNARYPVLTPDGRHVIFVRNLDKKVYQVDIDGTQERELVTFPDVSGLAISPDGQQIRVAVAHTASIWQSGSDGLNPHRIFTEHKESVAQGNWSPDGKHYFFQSWDGDRFNLMGCVGGTLVVRGEDALSTAYRRPAWLRNPHRQQGRTPSLCRGGRTARGAFGLRSTGRALRSLPQWTIRLLCGFLERWPMDRICFISRRNALAEPYRWQSKTATDGPAPGCRQSSLVTGRNTDCIHGLLGRKPPVTAI